MSGRRTARRDRARRWVQAPARVPNLTVVRPVPANQLTLGAVVWAHVLYQDHDGYKTRPAVVIATDRRSTVLLPGTTSQGRLRLPQRYHEVTDLGSAGLSRPTGIRLQATVVDRLDLVHLCGGLSDDDVEALTGRVDLDSARQLLEGVRAA
jgi:hypothetical protein